MGDDEARVDLAALNALEQWTEVTLYVALPGADGQRAVHQRADRELVDEAAVRADDRDDAAVAAGANGLAQRNRPIGLELERLLGAVVGVHHAMPVRLHA